MINLKDGRGKVPIRNSTQHEATPYLLVSFPDRVEFDRLYTKHKSQELKDRYWAILNSRAQGQTLEQSGKPFGLTRERVRQIEARFQRLVGESYRTQTEAILIMLSAHPLAVKSFLSSEMHGMYPPSDDSH
jgi:hypothetical protein